MIKIAKKILHVIYAESKSRGFYYSLIMNISHLIGVIRGLFFKILYFNNIKSTIFTLQSNSKIEIFNKSSRMNIGKFVFVRKNASFRLDFDGVLDLHDYVFINDNCTINCVNKIVIGKNTKIAPNVSINDHDHNYKGIGNHLVVGEVNIGSNVWIGSNVVILKDTVIGDNAIVAAGSIVKGTIPPNTLYYNKRESRFKEFASTGNVRGIL